MSCQWNKDDLRLLFARVAFVADSSWHDWPQKKEVHVKSEGLFQVWSSEFSVHERSTFNVGPGEDPRRPEHEGNEPRRGDHPDGAACGAPGPVRQRARNGEIAVETDDEQIEDWRVGH